MFNELNWVSAKLTLLQRKNVFSLYALYLSVPPGNVDCSDT